MGNIRALESFLVDRTMYYCRLSENMRKPCKILWQIKDYWTTNHSFSANRSCSIEHRIPPNTTLAYSSYKIWPEQFLVLLQACALSKPLHNRSLTMKWHWLLHSQRRQGRGNEKDRVLTVALYKRLRLMGGFWIHTPRLSLCKLAMNTHSLLRHYLSLSLSIFLYVSHRNLENVFALQNRWQFFQILFKEIWS